MYNKNKNTQIDNYDNWLMLASFKDKVHARLTIAENAI